MIFILDCQRKNNFLTGPIDDNIASLICAQIFFLNRESKKEIILYKLTWGYCWSGLAIYDTGNMFLLKL